MANSKRQPEPLDDGTVFSILVEGYQECLRARSTVDLVWEFQQLLAVARQSLVQRSRENPTQTWACAEEHTTLALAEVLIRRLIDGPTQAGHVYKLIESLSNGGRERLFRELESQDLAVVTRATFDQACEERDQEIVKLRELKDKNVKQAGVIIRKLIKMKAGPKRNESRVVALACAWVDAQEGSPYREIVKTVDKFAKAQGFGELKNRKRLMKAISDEKRENPLFDVYVELIQAERKRLRDPESADDQSGRS